MGYAMMMVYPLWRDMRMLRHLCWLFVCLCCLGLARCVVGQGVGDACQSSADCFLEKPVCSQNVCVACRNHSDCGIGRSCQPFGASSRCVGSSKEEGAVSGENASDGQAVGKEAFFDAGSLEKGPLERTKESNLSEPSSDNGMGEEFSGGKEAPGGADSGKEPQPEKDGPESSRCKDGQGRPCYGGPTGTEGKGLCRGGAQLCVKGVWGACLGEVTPKPETCDGKDNNCDGSVDEGAPGAGTSCKTGAFGACSVGKTACVKGKLECLPVSKQGAEVCDGKDNDCDGRVDENNPGGGGNCSTSKKGECKTGKRQCLSGTLQCVASHNPSKEVCDGKDNDCDGSTDEGLSSETCYVLKSNVCYKGTSACSKGKVECNSTSILSCSSSSQCDKCPGGSSSYSCIPRFRRCLKR